MAIKLLIEEDFSAKVVAYELGYKSVNAFYGAFKRWTGSTPRVHVNRIRMEEALEM